MSDPYVTLNMTVEDLLCHRSGLVTFSGDLIWYGSNKNAEEVVKAAAYLKPEYGFREQYGYSNIMYIAAGLIIEKISGQSWAEFIRQRFLEPLKMGRTLASTNNLADMENVASPYYYFGDKIHKLEWINWDNVVAAGGLISSVKDMSQWLILNLNEGSLDYHQLFDASSFEKLTSPYVNLKLSGYNKKYQPSMNFKAYGLGWSLMDLYGKKVISHGGGYDGMISKIWLAPEDSLGMVILTNSLSSLPSIIMDKSLDVLLGNNIEGTDFSALFKKHNEKQIQRAVEKLQDIESQREKINPLHLNLEDYTGSYYDPMYGRVEIELRNGQLYMNMLPTDIFHSELQHWNDHIFTFKFPEHQSSLPMGKLWFTFDAEAKINALKIEVDNPDFDFMEFKFIKSK